MTASPVGIKLDSHLVAGVQDDIHIVNLLQQGCHFSVPGVMPRQIPPLLRRYNFIVIK